jgi:hypothetical protein
MQSRNAIRMSLKLDTYGSEGSTTTLHVCDEDGRGIARAGAMDDG